MILKRNALKLGIFGCALLISVNLKSQDLPDGFKTWSSVGVSYKYSKKSKISIGQLWAFNTQPYQLQFIQTGIEHSTDLTKRLSMDFGFNDGAFRVGDSIKSTTHYYRIYNETHWESKINKLAIDNSIKSEWFFPQLKKYRYRFIYNLKFTLKTNKLPHRARPFIKGQLFYYLDGKPTTYFIPTTEDGKYIKVKNTPNNFHRYRIITGFSMKPTKQMSLSLYYLYQREFNNPFFGEFTDLHVVRPKSGKINNPFNNYSLVGLSLNWNIKKKK